MRHSTGTKKREEKADPPDSHLKVTFTKSTPSISKIQTSLNADYTVLCFLLSYQFCDTIFILSEHWKKKKKKERPIYDKVVIRDAIAFPWWEVLLTFCICSFICNTYEVSSITPLSLFISEMIFSNISFGFCILAYIYTFFFYITRNLLWPSS